MIKNALIEVQGDIFNIQNASEDEVEKLILSLEVGNKFSIRWIGTLVIQYITKEPYYNLDGEEKSIITLYCDKVVA